MRTFVPIFGKKASFLSNCLGGRRLAVVEWLNDLVPGFKLPVEASDEQLRVRLLDGFVFFCILRRTRPDWLGEVGSLAS